MRRLDELTDQEVIAHLARAREPASLREIAHALELRHHGRRALQKIVSRLKRKGEIEEVHSRRFRLAGKKARSEEHTSELQSLAYLVCRLLLEKKKKKNKHQK